MLDTRVTPISTRTRRSPGSARPLVTPRADTLRAEPLRADTLRRAVREQSAEEPVRRALPSARISRLANSEMRLMGLATVCTAVVCALLLVYLAAYAHVTQLGISQAQARQQLRQSQLRNQLLQAECNTLTSPQRVAAAAAALGMTPRGATPVNYVAARPAAGPENTTQPDAQMASSWDQGNNRATTEDSRAAASGGH